MRNPASDIMKRNQNTQHNIGQIKFLSKQSRRNMMILEQRHGIYP